MKKAVLIAKQHQASLEILVKSMDALARLFVRSKNYKQAILVFTDLLSLNVDEAHCACILHDLSKSHLKLGNFPSALKSAQSCVETAAKCGDKTWLVNGLIVKAQTLSKPFLT